MINEVEHENGNEGSVNEDEVVEERSETPPSNRASPATRSRSQSRSRSPSPKRKRSYSRSRSRSHSHSRKHRHRRYSRSRSRSPYRQRSRSRSRSREHGRSRSHRRNYRSRSRSPMSGRRRHMGSRENPGTSRCLGVFGLSLYTREPELRDVFSKFGSIEEVQIVYDTQTGRSRGFCFVYFKNTEDAVAAKEAVAGQEIDGRRIRVDYSITKRAHTPTPGIYMGKPTYGNSGNREHSPSPSPSYYKSSKKYGRSRSRSYSPNRRYRY
ncbi:Transformer-2 beta [Nymphon striatum]|nr:Transformer-2 beta [Nymphon striatum]